MNHLALYYRLSGSPPSSRRVGDARGITFRASRSTRRRFFSILTNFDLFLETHGFDSSLSGPPYPDVSES